MSTASSHQSLIATRASIEKKRAFAALAATRGLTESRLLMLLIDTVLERNAAPAAVDAKADGATRERVTLRLRPGDLALVAARAAARHMKPASYLVALVHAHVRRETPLPTHEIDTLKATVGQLSAVSRQLQSSAHGSMLMDRALREHLGGAIAHVDTVKQYVADIVRTNLISWETNDA